MTRRWWWLYATLAVTVLAFPTAEFAERLSRPSPTAARIERLQDRIVDYQARIVTIDRRSLADRLRAAAERAELLERIERLRVEIRDAGGTPTPSATPPPTTTRTTTTTTVRPPATTTTSPPTTTTSTTRPRRPCSVRVNRIACIRTGRDA